MVCISAKHQLLNKRSEIIRTDFLFMFSRFLGKLLPDRASRLTLVCR
jgi:hypothetical protein